MICGCPRGSPVKTILPMTVSLLAGTAGLSPPTPRLLNPAKRTPQRTLKVISGALVTARLTEIKTFKGIFPSLILIEPLFYNCCAQKGAIQWQRYRRIIQIQSKSHLGIERYTTIMTTALKVRKLRRSIGKKEPEGSHAVRSASNSASSTVRGT